MCTRRCAIRVNTNIKYQVYGLQGPYFAGGLRNPRWYGFGIVLQLRCLCKGRALLGRRGETLPFFENLK